MAIMNFYSLFAASEYVALEPTHFVSTLIDKLQGVVGNYAWTVVLFTVLLTLVLSPLDIWQKIVMYKNTKAMKRLQPKIEKLQKQYHNDKQTFQQKQLALYKEEGYSMLGACLPTIITLVLFFVIFAGFNATTQYMASKEYCTIATAWDQAYATEYTQKENLVKTTYATEIEQARQAAISDGKSADVAEVDFVNNKMADYETEIVAKADETVLNDPTCQPTSWLWVKNVFMPDNWSAVIPDYNTFTGSGLGKLGITTVNTTPEKYAKHVSALVAKYNTGWNGYLILPAITILLTLGSQLLMQKTNPQMPTVEDPNQPAGPSQQKMMQIMMPAMMGFFALFYSTVFTIYLVVRQAISSIMQLCFNLYASYQDKKEEDRRLSTTFKR